LVINIKMSIIIIEEGIPVLLTKDMTIVHEFLFEYMVSYFETEILTNKHIIKTIGVGLEDFDSLLKLYNIEEDLPKNKFILSASDIFSHINENDLLDYDTDKESENESENESKYNEAEYNEAEYNEADDEEYYNKMALEINKIVLD
jgi:hypothetical protein